MSLKKIVLVALLVLPLGQGVAYAHGDISSSNPEADSSVKKAPGHLIINFTESPTKSSVVKVKDGCGTEIVDNLDFSQKTAHVFVEDGRPGKWKVSYKVLSADDGHRTSGSYGFTVNGKEDCASDGGNSSGGNNNGSEGGPGDQAAGGPGNEEDDESSFPVVPIAIGSVGVIGLALIARRLSG